MCPVDYTENLKIYGLKNRYNFENKGLATNER